MAIYWARAKANHTVYKVNVLVCVWWKYCVDERLRSRYCWIMEQASLGKEWYILARYQKDLRVLCFHLFSVQTLPSVPWNSSLWRLRGEFSAFTSKNYLLLSVSLTLGKNLLPLMGNNPCDWASHTVCCLGNTTQFVLGHSNDKWNYA